MPPIRFAKRLIDDSHVVNEPLQTARYLPLGEQGIGSTWPSTAYASNPRLIFRLYTCDRPEQHITDLPLASERVTMVVMRELGCLRLCTMFTFQKIRRISAQPRAVKGYSFAEDSSWRGRQIGWIGEIGGPVFDRPSRGPALGSDLHSGRHRGRHRHHLRAIR